LAAFTFGLLIFTGLLWSSTEKLWAETRNSGRRQEADTRILQRAYISIEPQGIKCLSNETSDTTAVAHIGIGNVGHLPARDVKWAIKWAVDGRRYREDFPVAENEAFGRNVVSPGTIMTQGSDRFEFVEDAVGSEEGTFLYVWGAVYYLDGFDNTPPRTARFCHRYNYENLPSGDAAYFFKPDAARIHRYGNDAD